MTFAGKNLVHALLINSKTRNATVQQIKLSYDRENSAVGQRVITSYKELNYNRLHRDRTAFLRLEGGGGLNKMPKAFLARGGCKRPMGVRRHASPENV